MAQMLQAVTFHVDEACRGEAALQAVAQARAAGQPYDIVYLDWRMPGLDGTEKRWFTSGCSTARRHR